MRLAVSRGYQMQHKSTGAGRTPGDGLHSGRGPTASTPILKPYPCGSHPQGESSTFRVLFFSQPLPLATPLFKQKRKHYFQTFSFYFFFFSQSEEPLIAHLLHSRLWTFQLHGMPSITFLPRTEFGKNLCSVNQKA